MIESRRLLRWVVRELLCTGDLAKEGPMRKKITLKRETILKLGDSRLKQIQGAGECDNWDRTHWDTCWVSGTYCFQTCCEYTCMGGTCEGTCDATCDGTCQYSCQCI